MSINKPDLPIEALTPLLETGSKRWLVALSGGLDSIVLLNWLHSVVNREKISLQAAHIHHGLSADADNWQRHCQQQCDDLGVPLKTIRVSVDRSNGSGLEGAARDARYAAFEQLMQPTDMLITAHHSNDQAESVLLALLRGSGGDGLSAMPTLRQFGSGLLARPLLAVSREQLLEWATARQLRWVNDASNSDRRIRRNFLRHEVLPLIETQWPAAQQNLRQVAALQAEQRELLEASAEKHFQQARRHNGMALAVEYLLSLSFAEQKLLIRYWLRRLNLPLPGQRHWSQLTLLLEADSGRNPVWHFTGGELRRYKGACYAMRELADVPPGSWSFNADGLCTLPENFGVLRLGGKSSTAISHLQVSFRQGGEKFFSSGAQQHKSLKKWLQTQNILPWLRDRTPLLWWNDGGQKQLVAFGNRWLVEQPETNAMVISWQPGQTALSPLSPTNNTSGSVSEIGDSS